MAACVKSGFNKHEQLSTAKLELKLSELISKVSCPVSAYVKAPLPSKPILPPVDFGHFHDGST